MPDLTALTALTTRAARWAVTAVTATPSPLPLPSPSPVPASSGSGVGLLTPLAWIGEQAVAPVTTVIAQAWTTGMLALWGAGLWLLKLAFTVVDALATPDVSASGPLAGVLPTTMWIGGALAVVMLFVQVGVALIRRDGASIGRVFLGVVQFGFVWAAYLTIAAATVRGAADLEHAILAATLHVDTLSAWDWTTSWPRTMTDTAAVTVMGVASLLLVIPAGFAMLIVALVRDAALLVLVATAPISAAGLLHDTNRAWMWKTTRWFISAVLIGPLSALVLGVGVKLTDGVVQGAGDSTVAAVGTAIVGAVLVVVAACSPLVLFRLLAFVEPSTVSGAAMRQAWVDASAGRGQGAAAVGGGAAVAGDGGGRSAGEAGADTAATSRMAGALSGLGAVGAAYARGMQATVGAANRAVDLGTDVLGSAGVGHAGYSMTPADERALRERQQGIPDPGDDATDGAGGGATPSPTPGPGGTPGAMPGPLGGGPGSSPTGGSTGGPGAGAAAGDVGAAEAGLMLA